MRPTIRSTLLLSLLLALVASPAFGRNDDRHHGNMGRKDNDGPPTHSVPEQASTGWLMLFGIGVVAFGAKWHNKTSRS